MISPARGWGRHFLLRMSLPPRLEGSIPQIMITGVRNNWYTPSNVSTNLLPVTNYCALTGNHNKKERKKMKPQHQRVLAILRPCFCHPRLLTVWIRAADKHWLTGRERPLQRSSRRLLPFKNPSYVHVIARCDGQIQLSHRSLPLVNTAPFFSSLLTPVSVSLHPQWLANILHLHYSRLLCLCRPTQSQQLQSLIDYLRDEGVRFRVCDFTVIRQVFRSTKWQQGPFRTIPTSIPGHVVYSQFRYSRRTEGRGGDCLCMATRSHGNWWHGSFSVGWAEGKDVGAGTHVQEKKNGNEWWKDGKQKKPGKCILLAISGALIMAYKPKENRNTTERMEYFLSEERNVETQNFPRTEQTRVRASKSDNTVKN